MIRLLIKLTNLWTESWTNLRLWAQSWSLKTQAGVNKCLRTMPSLSIDWWQSSRAQGTERSKRWRASPAKPLLKPLRNLLTHQFMNSKMTFGKISETHIQTRCFWSYSTARRSWMTAFKFQQSKNKTLWSTSKATLKTTLETISKSYSKTLMLTCWEDLTMNSSKINQAHRETGWPCKKKR